MANKIKKTISKKPGTAINAFINTHWAITEDRLREVLSLVTDSYEAFFDVDGEYEKPVINGDRGVINISGVIFKYSNIITMLGMGTSTEDVNRQIDDLLNAGIKKIDFKFDTPGGQVSGTNATSDRIKNLKVETRAIIAGECCSAGYWLASACDMIEASDETDIIGSIGIMLTVMKKDETDEVEIVSSNAPLKNPDVESEEGYGAYKAIVDQLEAVFIEKVARNRGTDEKSVKESYGKGGIMIARDALSVGMIDSITTLTGGNMEITVALLKKDYKTIVDELTQEATSDLNDRIVTLEGENTTFVTEVANLKKEKSDLAAKIKTLTPEDSNIPESVKNQIAMLEKNLIESKLVGFPDEFKSVMTDLQGTVPVETITKIATAVNSMKKIINDLGAPMGKTGGDGDLKSLDDRAEELKTQYIKDGMSPYEAHKKAYREASK